MVLSGEVYLLCAIRKLKISSYVFRWSYVSLGGSVHICFGDGVMGGGCLNLRVILLFGWPFSG